MNYKVSNYDVIDGLGSISNPKDGESAKVTDSKLEGHFIYDSSSSHINNNGTNINGWMRQFSGDVNVQWFGAQGDGKTDDRAAINHAIEYAASKKQNLFFPQGIYQINSGDILHKIPYGILINNISDFRLTGEKGTVFRTHITAGNTINKWSLLLLINSAKITIENIEFKNDHVAQNPDQNYTTTNEPRGIYLFGKALEDITIRQNTFSGFYRAILLNGGKNTQILSNTFLSYNGRDDSAFQVNPEIEFKFQFPAVYIGVVSNANGINTDIVVKDNHAEGYSGTDINTTQIKRSMDGFYYGYANGALIENNTLLKFGVEAIYCFGFEKYDPKAEIKQTIIRGNHIDSRKPSGSITKINFGIRADGSNYLIEDNYICAGFGILCYGIENNRVAKNVMIRNNEYHADPSLHNNWKPIFVQGYNKKRAALAKDYTIENNSITIKDIGINEPLFLITLADAEDITIINNTFHVENVVKNESQTIAFYKFVKHCRNIHFGQESHNNNYDHITIEGFSNSNLNLTYNGSDSI